MGPQMARGTIPVVFFTLFLFGSAEANHLNATAPAPGSGSACSVNVCDFYFQGSENSVPVFQLTTPPDSPMGSQVVDSVSSLPMEVDSTSGSTNLLTGATSSDSTFYITGQPAQLQHRSFDVPPMSAYENICYKLAVTSAQVQSGNTVINLNPGDNNAAYPESRRCVVFQTGPSGSQQSQTAAPAPSPSAPTPSPAPTPAPSPMPMPMPMPPCPTACPENPTQDCDFYFLGAELFVPTVNLSNTPGMPLSPRGVRSIVVNVNSPVAVTQSGPSKILACPEPMADAAVANQFYLSGVDALLYDREFQAAPGIEYFKNQCYKLSINAGSVLLGDESVVSISAGDGSIFLPESRRCVVFKTV